MTDALFSVLMPGIGALAAGLLNLHRRRPPAAASAGFGWRAKLVRLRADGAVDLGLLLPCGLGFALAWVLQAVHNFGDFGYIVLTVLLAPPAVWLIVEELLLPLKGHGIPMTLSIAVLVIGGFGVVLAGGLQGHTSTSQAQGAMFPVAGTRIDGHPGLNQRTGPGPQYSIVGHRLADGTLVTPVCTADGPPSEGHRSRRWVRLSNGRFVYGLFLDLPAGPQVLRTCGAGELPDHVT
jgi:hypothetical protein